MKIYKTSYSGARFDEISEEKPSDKACNTITIRSNVTYQKHMGFGGSFTDSAAEIFASLDDEKKKELCDAYYGEKGLKYNLARVTVHSSDFSKISRCYVKQGDKDLSSFDMSYEDEKRVPFIKECLKRNPNIRFLASPWSPPAYMKSNKMMAFGGKLLDKYRSLWAGYYAKFILGLKDRGINIEFVTVQNEPEAVQVWESRIVGAKEEALEIRDFLYPTFKKHGLDIKFLLWDHNRDRMLNRVVESLNVEGVNELIYGIGYHWYCCKNSENLRAVHELYPDKHLLLTECCVELAHDSTTGKASSAGVYEHGERYGNEIMNDFKNYSEGYIDWNLALDKNGGPNHVGNFCEAPIMLNKKGELVYNPSYYYIGHFSKFIKEGASRILSNSGLDGLNSVAYINPNCEKVIVVMNMRDDSVFSNIDIDNKFFGIKLDKHSIITIIV